MITYFCVIKAGINIDPVVAGVIRSRYQCWLVYEESPSTYQHRLIQLQSLSFGTDAWRIGTHKNLDISQDAA